MRIAGRRPTLDEFPRLPEEKPALELVDGEVTQKVSPKTVHSVLQYEGCAQINGFARPRKLGRAFPEHRSSYAGASTVPDVAVFVWDRLPRDAAGRWIDDVDYPPDIAIKILSPGQTLGDLDTRCRWYVANAVRVAILVEPRRRQVRVYWPGAAPDVVTTSGSIDMSEVIPGFGFDVGSQFAALDED